MTRIKRLYHSFWDGDGGARQALQIAIPMILATSSFTIMQFVDRKFLLIYSANSFAAAAPAGMASFCLISFWMGTVSYINTFIAQYIGSNQPKKVGSALWQAIYLSLFSWLCLLPFNALAASLFNIVGHPAAIIADEVTYFTILNTGSGLVLLNVSLSSFFSGQGKTYTVMIVRVLSVLLNIPLDYAMIFGKWGFPELGMAGAGLSTIIATGFTTVVFSCLIFTKDNDFQFSTKTLWKFNKDIFFRLTKYGLPNGVQFFINMFAFSFFLLMIGRLGSEALAASNAAWSINMLAVLPMIGFAIAISTIIGQEIGRQRIHIAKLATRNVFIMVLMFMGFMSICFLFFPEKLLWLMFSGAPIENVANIKQLSILIMRFMALYTLFDAIDIVYSSAIKAAGDTRFVMWVSIGLSFSLLVLPGYLFSTVWPSHVSVMWAFATLYTILMATTFAIRYRKGHWETMNVIGLS